MSKVAVYGTLAAALATVAHLLHGLSHAQHEVPLSVWQWAYVISVIFVAPVVAAVLLWTRYRLAGAWLLLASLGGALLFGLVFHYLIPGADNVFTLEPGPWRGPFSATAAFVAFSEVLGTLIGIWAVVRLSRDPSDATTRSAPAAGH